MPVEDIARMSQTLSAAVCLVLMLLALIACSPQTETHGEQFTLLGTHAEVTVSNAPEEKALAAIGETVAVLRAFDSVGYTFGKGTELRRLNAALAQGEPFTASPELVELIRISRKLSRQSGGLFNPAAGELTALWEYHCLSEPCPESPYPDEVMKLVEMKDKSVLEQNPAMEDIVIDGNVVRSDNTSVKLEFGDVIRGFAMDKGIERLEALGIGDAMIDVGPSVRAMGSKGEHPWWVGLHDAAGEHILGIIELPEDESVVTVKAFATSAAVEGTIHRHVVNPMTGMPVKGIASATVVHDSAAVASVAAASLLVAGIDNWKTVADRMGVRALLLFADDGSLYISSALSPMIHWRTEVSHELLRH
jgi:thiamine biosynthesis lipoprotein